MKNARPSLSSLVAKKGRPPQSDAAPTPSAAPDKGSAEAVAPSDRVGVMVRLTAAERKALRQIALNGDTTVQALIEESVKDIIRRHEA